MSVQKNLLLIIDEFLRLIRFDANVQILITFSIVGLIFVDHFRIHRYWFDTHDLLLQTDSGLGFDSHEFWAMAMVLVAILLSGRQIARRIVKK